MKAHIKIGLKNSVIGLLSSALAATTVVLAIKHYAGPVPPMLLPCAAALAVYVAMNRALWRGVKRAYDAGEVGRRMDQLEIEHMNGRVNAAPSKWFARESESVGGTNCHPTVNKKALPAMAPEGLV